MKIKIALIFLIVTQVSFAQQYDSKKISNHTVVNLLESDFIGFEEYGIVYYVEADLRTIVAFEKKKNKIKWKTNIISACGIPNEGKPEVRYLKMHKGNLHITYGKHNEAEIEAEDGKLFLCGSD